MKQLTLQHGVLLTLVAVTPLCAALSAEAQTAGRHSDAAFAGGTISGIIRDADGVPQMGALVQVLLPDTTPGASAITDSRGRYRILLEPGSYRIRATAALFMPAVREHLQIARGTRSIVDLTLSTLLAPTGWLPAARRTTSEPSDDWMWTLRSSASRPILRYTDPNGSVIGNTSTSNGTSTSSNAPSLNDVSDAPLAISSSRQESRRGVSGGRITLKNSDGGFGTGGSHSILVMTRVNEDGSGSVLRMDMSGPRTPYPVAPSAEISVGMQRRTMLNGFSRAVLTYSGHPELTSGNTTGMQGATLRTAQRIEMGDTLRIDAGSVMRASNIGGNALAIEPFLRVAAKAGGSVVLAYSLSHARGTESIEDLDRVQAATPIAVMRSGHLRLATGSHQALSAAGKVRGGGTVEVAIYSDRLHNPLIAGTGVLSAAQIAGTDGLIADPTTNTLRVAAQDYNSAGARVGFRQPVTRSLSVGVEGTSGRALRAARLTNASLSDVMNSLNPTRIYAATAYADGKVLRTGTTIRASYRWQPERTLTAVDSFRVTDESAYLSCSLRQSLGRTRILPQGLEAVIDLQNLLAQGYQPFLSADGQTLYLAQAPRTLQAGLSFTF